MATEAMRFVEKRGGNDSEDESEELVDLPLEIATLIGGEKGGGNDSEDECEELVDLPLEIATLIGGDRVHKSEDALQKALEEAGVGDLRVVLVDGKPRLVMPSDQHNAFTSAYVLNFALKWGKNKWGFSSGTHKTHLQNGSSRDPDISCWGYHRCSKKPGTGRLEPINLGDSPMPDVVVQFSWQNKKMCEEGAVDDVMNRGLEDDQGAPSMIRPTLGYLIKARFSKKRTLVGAIKGSKTQDMEGLDMHRLPHGTTIADACDPTNSDAEHWRCVAGGPEAVIAIKPQDLGITGVWAVLCGEHKIKSSDLFGEMQGHHTRRQSRGLAT